MALSSAQRARLPNSAFVYPKQRKYPVPTKAQARKAGISESQRLRVHRNALARANQKQTSGSYGTVAKKVRSRSGGKVTSVARGKGSLSPPKRNRSRRGRARGTTMRRRRR
jgi:hypothetical protein